MPDMNKRASAKASLRGSLFPRGKRGMAPATIGELILVITMGIIILWVVMGIAGYLSPTTASVGCGLNLRVTAATLSHSTAKGPVGGEYTFIGAPVLMCNQYQTPVDINAANFRACPGIADFCSKAKGTLLEECWRQCARIQVDKLTDTCWSMAGSGRLDFKDTVFDKAKGIAQNPWTVGPVVVAGVAGYALLGPWGAKLAAGAVLYVEYRGQPDSKAKILRCFRYRIVNPMLGTNRQTMTYYDNTSGHSWAYDLNDSKLSNPKTCAPSEENMNCSFGGEGVVYINELGNVVKNSKVTQDAADRQANAGRRLNYQITDPRNQVCYIAYYQGGSGEKYTTRSCKSWNQYTGDAHYMN